MSNLNPNAEQLVEKNAEIITNEFVQSMNALQTQDLAQSNRSLMLAHNALNFLNRNLEDPDRVLPYSIMCKLISVSNSILKISFYQIEERIIKAMEETNRAWFECNEAQIQIPLIPLYVMEEPPFYNLIPIIKNAFSCFEILINSSKIYIEGVILKDAGKYVDEVKVLENYISELRKVNDVHLEQDTANIFINFPFMLNNIADSTEKKLERLREKRKKIEFLRPIDKKVFIVHGHDMAILQELTFMLKDSHGIEPVVLNAMPDNGHTVIEKFEEYARHCAFAFVIFTPDDFVENKKKKYFQGRPNVLFELGWFCGRFGRDKVRILRQKDTQLPSDLNGIVTIDFHERLEEVFRKITFDLEYNGILEKSTAYRYCMHFYGNQVIYV